MQIPVAPGKFITLHADTVVPSTPLQPRPAQPAATDRPLPLEPAPAPAAEEKKEYMWLCIAKELAAQALRMIKYAAAEGLHVVKGMKPCKFWGTKGMQRIFKNRVYQLCMYGAARDAPKRVGEFFMRRDDGATDPKGKSGKQYWMMAGKWMLTNGLPYKFGKYVVHKMDPDPTNLREELEALATQALREFGIEVPKNMGPYTVVCKYRPRAGVGEHSDTDYKSSFPWVVSFSPLGKAQFKMKISMRDRWHTVMSAPEYVLIFDRTLIHAADGAEDDMYRINATVRWAEYGEDQVFLTQ